MLRREKFTQQGTSDAESSPEPLSIAPFLERGQQDENKD